jgi:hypothetical protein
LRTVNCIIICCRCFIFALYKFHNVTSTFPKTLILFSFSFSLLFFFFFFFYDYCTAEAIGDLPEPRVASALRGKAERNLPLRYPKRMAHSNYAHFMRTPYVVQQAPPPRTARPPRGGGRAPAPPPPHSSPPPAARPPARQI